MRPLPIQSPPSRIYPRGWGEGDYSTSYTSTYDINTTAISPPPRPSSRAAAAGGPAPIRVPSWFYASQDGGLAYAVNEPDNNKKEER